MARVSFDASTRLKGKRLPSAISKYSSTNILGVHETDRFEAQKPTIAITQTHGAQTHGAGKPCRMG